MKWIRLLLLMLPAIASAQRQYSGLVLQKNSNEPLPFASLALIRENVGTNSDEQGLFVLHSYRSQPNDTVLISSVGFQSLRLPVAVFQHTDTVWLEKMPTVLKPVHLVSKKNWIRRTLNNVNRCGTDYLQGSADTQLIAQLMEADTVGYQLTQLTICKYAIPLIQPEKCIFRLQILAYDSVTGGPGVLLNDSLIEVKTSDHRVQVDLEAYHLRMADRRFYVALEWLRIPYNAGTEKFRMDGAKMRQTVYSPLLCHDRYTRNHPRPPDAPYQVWYRDYRGRWKPMQDVKRLMMEAQIKY